MSRSAILIFSLVIIATVCLAAVNPVSLPYIAQEKFDGRSLKLVKVLAENDIYIRYYVTYMSGKLKISGIMNVPKGKGPYPVVITAHGFINPEYYTTGRGLKREQDYLARRGYIVLHPDYRNHNGSDKDPDNNLRLNLGYTEDVINAVYAVKNSGSKLFDKDNIGLLGHSLGGGIALNMMVTKPGLVKAYVLFAPISMDYRDNFNKWIVGHTHPEKGFLAKYGSPATREKIIETYGSPEANPKFWDELSPKTFIRDIEDPVIIHQGTADKDVPPEWSQRLAKALKDNGKDVVLYIYKGEPHEFINAWPLVMERSAKFFDKQLK
jgi:dipeptidyl aminopeptidase/acylaminoacyl peptidase